MKFHDLKRGLDYLELDLKGIVEIAARALAAGEEPMLCDMARRRKTSML